MDELEPGWQTTSHSLHAVFGSKWSLHVLRLLHTGARGFNEMKREIDGITATMLSRRLEELRCHGFVDRTVEETTPPTTTYRLTPTGTEIVAHLEGIAELATLCHDRSGVETGDCANESDLACATGDGGICMTVSDPDR